MGKQNQGRRTNATMISTMRRLRMLGKSVRETAKITGFSPFTVQRHTKAAKKED